MAAVKGQPAPKPGSLKSPALNAAAKNEIDQALEEGAKNPPKIPAIPDAGGGDGGLNEIDHALGGAGDSASAADQPPAGEGMANGESFGGALSRTVGGMFSMSDPKLQGHNDQAYPAGAQPTGEPVLDPNGYAAKALDYIPAVGQIAGGIAGEIADPLGGGVPGAMAGGAGGEGLKRYLQYKLLKDRPAPSMNDLPGVLSEGGKSGAVQAIAMGTGPALEKGLLKGTEVLAGGSKAATETMMNAPQGVRALVQVSGGDPAVAARYLQDGWTDAVSTTKAALEQPVKQLVESTAASSTAREAGDQIKQAYIGSLQQKYGTFVDSYSGLNQVAQKLPLSDDSLLKFGDSLKSQILDQYDNQPKIYNALKSEIDNIYASGTGEKLEGLLRGSLQDSINSAYKGGNTALGKALLSLKNQTEDFLDSRVSDLAKRVVKGNISPEEQGFFDTLQGQMGQAQPQAVGYQQALQKTPQQMQALTYGVPLKKMAAEYLAKKDSVDAGYSAFKQLLSDVSEQTGVKSSKSTVRFLTQLDNTPAEDIVKSVFDPKNSRMMQNMATQNPEAFDVLRRHIIGKMYNDAGGDVGAFHEAFSDLPPEVRNLFFSPAQQQTMSQTLANPRLVELNKMSQKLASKIGLKETANGASRDLIAAGNSQSGNQLRVDLGKLSQLTGTNMLSDVQNLAALDQFAAKGGSLKNRLLGIALPPAKKAIRAATAPVVSPALRGVADFGGSFMPGSGEGQQ